MLGKPDKKALPVYTRYFWGYCWWYHRFSVG